METLGLLLVIGAVLGLLFWLGLVVLTLIVLAVHAWRSR